MHGHDWRKTGTSDSNLSYPSAREHLEPQPPLPTGSRSPIAALHDTTLDDRVHQALVTFLGEHELANKVLAKAATLLEDSPHPIFCSGTPECTATIHDWRIRVLEPLLKFLLRHYTHKTTGLPVDPDQYRLSFTTPDASQPSGITLNLLERHRGRISSVPIVFEHDSSFWCFGPQPNLFARKGQCKLYLEQTDPIPLDPSIRSHGAQAMLNRLAVSMELAVKRNPQTGEIMCAPRFGMLISTRMSVLAEVVENPRNAQEIGFLFSSILLDPDDETQSRGGLPLPFLFNRRSSTLARLFGGPSIDKQEWRQVWKQNWLLKLQSIPMQKTPSSSVEVWNGSLFAVRAGLAQGDKSLRFICKPQGRMGRFLGIIVMEAIKFKVFQKPQSANAQSYRRYKPSRRLSALPPPLVAFLERGTQPREGSKRPRRLSGLEVEDPELLPALEFHQLIAMGGAGWVYGGILSQAPSQLQSNLPNVVSVDKPKTSSSKLELEHRQVSRPKRQLPTRKSHLPFDEPIIIKAFRPDHRDSFIQESFFYEKVFPLLSPEAQAVLPRYHGTFRSTDGSVYMLILGFSGRHIEEKDCTDETRAKIAAAFELLVQQGVAHGDEEERNILIRDDDSICIIDFDCARLDFDPEVLRDPV
ncbi:BZ3500_MvSof-1268-A1-R1_Chr5-3g08319 [Microbotryum saponariae]|uniref:BZ3500_MvSof-1268-A1-R1_Chr5-3g08319 protein n=1 Tax=Microbotryum saponariae TaxID=289078 RepID=A0A2X0NRG8_9BASI|nr:BZ3500_MvSof-1268-A1-R1_Chr5-3g08319 [Microbotryum saponariae]SDA08427.1 BZ3501_MvSof-1269-A2-R1_Chr5-3g08047 [Microbotryum saponariae]